MNGGRFELFDHTADMGLRVWSPTLAGLIAAATEGLYAAIGELATSGAPEPLELDFRGEDTALLLRDYLAELLLIFERDRRLATRCDVQHFDARRLAVATMMAAVDVERSVFAREVKAVTYHGLAIRRTQDAYEATIIVDI